MEKSKKERLEAEGWKVGTVAEFLQLIPEESTLLTSRLQPDRPGEYMATLP